MVKKHNANANMNSMGACADQINRILIDQNQEWVKVKYQKHMKKNLKQKKASNIFNRLQSDADKRKELKNSVSTLQKSKNQQNIEEQINKVVAQKSRSQASLEIGQSVSKLKSLFETGVLLKQGSDLANVEDTPD